MIARALWYVCLAAIGVVTAGLQLDRASEASPELAPLVPQPFRAFAQERIVAARLIDGETDETLREARRLVVLRPMPAEHFTMLASAQDAADEVEASTRTIQLAAARGWRDPVAQTAMAGLALGVGDASEAARRYTALIVQPDVPDDLLVELGLFIFDEAGGPGRSTMAEIVSGTERWGDVYLRRGPSVMPPDAFREVTARSIELGARFECGAFNEAVRRLSRRDESAGAALAASAPAACVKVR